MKRRKLGMFFWLIMFVWLGRVGAQVESTPDFVVRCASSLEKIFPDTFKDEWLKKGINDEVEIGLARNESESFQIVVIPFKNLTNLRWKVMSDINPEYIRIQPVGYVEVVKNNNRLMKYPKDEIKTGWWPDPLFSTWKKIGEISAGKVQPIWVTIDIPKHTLPGKYEVTIVLFADGTNKAKVTVKVNVWNFALPERTHLKTSFWYSYRDFAGYYPEKKRNLWPTIKEFLKLALDNRVTPVNIDERWPGKYWSRISFNPETGEYSFDFTEVRKHLNLIFKESMKKGNVIHVLEHHFCRGIDVTAEIKGRESIKHLKPSTNEMETFLIQYLSAWKKFLKENGWFNYAYVYYTDEPRPDVWEAVRWLYPIVKKVVPEWKTISSIGLCRRSAYKEGVEEQIDILVPNLIFTLPSDLDYYLALQEQGKEIWGYVCSQSSCIDYQAVDIRILPWICWKYNLKGFLYWGLFTWNYEKPPKYKTIEGMMTDNPKKRWPYKAKWQPGIFKKGEAGDGYLIYPSPEGEPWSSIRLENLRDGIEDYEYFYLLKEKLDELKKRNKRYRAVIHEGENLLKLGEDVIKNPLEYTRDQRKIQERRKKIKRIIEKISKILTEGGEK